MTRPPGLVDLRKLDATNQNMPLILRQTKPIDQMVMLLGMIKTVLKAQKVTLYVIEDQLRENIFGY